MELECECEVQGGKGGTIRTKAGERKCEEERMRVKLGKEVGAFYAAIYGTYICFCMRKLCFLAQSFTIDL